MDYTTYDTPCKGLKHTQLKNYLDWSDYLGHAGVFFLGGGVREGARKRGVGGSSGHLAPLKYPL